MTWKLLVVRKDSPIRMYNVSRGDCVTALAQGDQDAFRGVAFDRFLIDHHGAFHVDLAQLQGLMRAMLQRAAQDEAYFSRLADWYEKIGLDWLAWCEAHCAGPQGDRTDDELLGTFREFITRYVDYVPVLFAPFAVELRYQTEYPQALERLVARSSLGGIEEAKRVVEASGRRTMSEEKTLAVKRLATRFREELGSPPRSLDDLEKRSPSLREDLGHVTRQHAWLAHWGYPPFYRASTEEEILAEAGRATKAEVRSEDEPASLERSEILASARLTSRETVLFDDIARWNHLRTWRMEVKIRAQYLSIPLLREIERRAIATGSLDAEDDIFFLIPPEIEGLLKGQDRPRRLAARRTGWILLREGGATNLLTGRDYNRLHDVFMSAVEDTVEARSVQPVDRQFVGGKAVGLYALRKAGLQVPSFFVVTTHAYRSRGQLSSEVRRAIEKRGEALGPALMVRSSATIEDSEDASWAGRFKSCSYIEPRGLWDAIEEVWDSLQSESAASYAGSKGLQLSEAEMAVVVQRLVEPRISGVADVGLADGELTGVVEVAFGHGSALVGGDVTPTTYAIREDRLEIVRPGRQAKQLRGGEWIPCGAVPDLSSSLRRKLLEALQGVLVGLGGSQNVEFCVAEDELWILQARPTSSLQIGLTDGEEHDSGSKILVRGLPGQVRRVLRAQARILAATSDADRLNDGEILVIHAATPAWDPVIVRAGAVVTNEGGATSHAIRVCNELGLPVVVGAHKATSVVPDGEEVLVDTMTPFDGIVRVVPQD